MTRTTLTAIIIFLAAVCHANAHDLYVGTYDPITKGICCTTSEHAGYGDLTVEQARRINPLRQVPVDTFIPDARVQPSMDGNYHVCIPATSVPNRGDFFCFFVPSQS